MKLNGTTMKSVNYVVTRREKQNQSLLCKNPGKKKKRQPMTPSYSVGQISLACETLSPIIVESLFSSFYPITACLQSRGVLRDKNQAGPPKATDSFAENQTLVFSAYQTRRFPGENLGG
jgi:hypothetical protein